MPAPPRFQRTPTTTSFGVRPKNCCSRLDRLGTSALSGAALSLADAQRALASEYGYPSWPRLRQGVTNARGRINGLRAARPVFDDKTTGGDALLAPSNSTMFTTLDDRPRIGVTCLSPGATAKIGQVENQFALGGADRFVIVGTAGSIRPDVAPGSVVDALGVSR